jgi:hypothetical protein
MKCNDISVIVFFAVRAMVQATSRLPIRERLKFRYIGSHCGIYGVRSDTGTGVFEILLFLHITTFAVMLPFIGNIVNVQD